MPKRILFLHPSGAGGGAVSMSLVIRVLVRRGFECFVLGGPGAGGVLELWERAGASARIAPYLRPFHHSRWNWAGLHDLRAIYYDLSALVHWAGARRALLRDLADLRPQVVYGNSIQAAPYCLAAKQAGLSAVLHVREPAARGYLGLRRALLRRAFRRLDHVFFISEWERRTLGLEGLGTVVHNWVESSDWPTPDFEAAAADPPRILYVGGISWIKGAARFLDALQVLERLLPGRFSGVFLGAPAQAPAGEPPGPQARGNRAETPAAQGLASRMPGLRSLAPRSQPDWHRHILDALDRTQRLLGPRLELHAWTNDVRPFFRESQIVVFPAAVGHFARPLVEAAAAGRPAVASDFPETRVVLRPGRTGLLARPGDPESLAAALAELVRHPDLRVEMGRAARQVYESQFTERNGEIIADILEGLSQ